MSTSLRHFGLYEFLGHLFRMATSSAAAFTTTSINSAPSDWTCSRTTERVSNPCTIAPKHHAGAVALRPATPAPITRTLHGGTYMYIALFSLNPICLEKDRPYLPGQGNSTKRLCINYTKDGKKPGTYPAAVPWLVMYGPK